MKAWLVDCYRNKNRIILWVKTPEDIRIEKRFSTSVYIKEDDVARKFLAKHKLKCFPEQKKNYLRENVNVFRLPVFNLQDYERFVYRIEKNTRFRAILYNADVKPEQLFLYKHRLRPFSPIRLGNSSGKSITPLSEEAALPLKKFYLKIILRGNVRSSHEQPVLAAVINNMRFEGSEKSVLRQIAKAFIQQDPDVLIMDYAFSHLPYLVERMKRHCIGCPFHRWDPIPIKYKGGRSYFTYGQVRYQDYAIRLHGRLLIDTSTMVGNVCDVDAIVELCQLSGTLFQQLASKSFGAVFQNSLVREMIEQDLVVHYKSKPVDKPMSMFQLLKADRGGHVFDPEVGFHKNVAEIDFCSMFPWLIYNHNISSDTIQCKEPPLANVPGVPITVSMSRKGLVPLSIKPLIDKRMEYKKNPTSINKARAVGLKWVLVSSYGYLRYREFKLGIPSSHMAICSYARETILQAARLAEDYGFQVVHGIIDSLYIKSKNKKITENSIRLFCRELEELTGIPVGFEGIFKWIAFLPSMEDQDRPITTKYFGAFKHGGLKTRGIEVRQRTPPLAVKFFQQKVLESMAECSGKLQIRERMPQYCRMLRRMMEKLPALGHEWLTCTMKVSRTDYKSNIPQKKIVERLKRKGITVLPGQTIQFVFQRGKIVLPEEYNGLPDLDYYKRLLVKSLYVLMQPFGYSMQDITDQSGKERQSVLREYSLQPVPHVYIPMFREKLKRQGLSERRIKQRLESQGWKVWRGGLLNILRDAGYQSTNPPSLQNSIKQKSIQNSAYSGKLDYQRSRVLKAVNNRLYPNVKKKYELLERLMTYYHPGSWPLLQYYSRQAGMPDYVCFRNGEFKFVECKLGHEQLSKRQKLCIARLQEGGFKVEVHKLVDDCTKARRARVNMVNGKKELLEVQVRL